MSPITKIIHRIFNIFRRNPSFNQTFEPIQFIQLLEVLQQNDNRVIEGLQEQIKKTRGKLRDAKAELEVWKWKMFKCEKCQNVFGEKQERVPKVLACGHTICSQCALSLIVISTTENGHQEVICPFDNSPTILKKDQGIQDLPTNLVLLKSQIEMEEEEEEENSDGYSVIE